MTTEKIKTVIIILLASLLLSVAISYYLDREIDCVEYIQSHPNVNLNTLPAKCVLEILDQYEY